MNQPQSPNGILIPWEQLSSQALAGVIEEFVTRDGTDYGTREISLEEKMAAVQQQLHTKKAVIVFDPESETCTILPAGHPAVRALRP